MDTAAALRRGPGDGRGRESRGRTAAGTGLRFRSRGVSRTAAAPGACARSAKGPGRGAPSAGAAGGGRGTRRGPGDGRGSGASRGRGAEDTGLSSVEVVFLAPLILAFTLVLVAFGQQVSGRSEVDGAARDAARAGSLERSDSAAVARAESVARAQLGDVCLGGTVDVQRISDGSHAPDTLFTVTVSCDIRGLALLGVPATQRLTGRSSSPIDPHRRSGEG